ncbi:CBN-CUL-4 protein [Caenorhabditis brenneri]|uniref:CBN-CUL-4 protein n=1 Tax=Caenorhabditis brenneri TaxID=135651 RepID=G0N9C8_CAEBE|nr:CBN-CUL-4 protein [Caenorhabditis brenneri]
MKPGANQSNSAEKSKSKPLRKPSKRSGSSIEGTETKQMRGDNDCFDEEMEDVSTSNNCRKLNSNNLQENFRDQPESASRSATNNDRRATKIVIKNFKGTASGNTNGLDSNNATNTSESIEKDWAVLSDNVYAILEDRKTFATMETLFSRVRAVCDKNKLKELYDRIKAIVDGFAKNLRDSMNLTEHATVDEDNCEQYLAKFGSIWEKYPVKINLIRNIFLYLDRIAVSTHDQEITPLWDCFTRIFQITFFPDISKDFTTVKLFSAIFIAMQKMMDKRPVDTPLKNLIEMLQTIHVGEYFSNFLLSQLREYYNNQRLALVPVLTCNEYMEFAEDQIRRYSNLIKLNFDEPSALKEVQMTITNCLIQQAIPEILTRDFDELLSNGSIEDINRMFDLCRQCSGGEEEVRTQFSKYMKSRGERLIASCPDDDLVTELLAFKKRIDFITSGSFQSASDHTKMRQCISDAFESFVNKNVDRAAELISKHFHTLLHSGNKNVTDESSLDQMVDDAIVLFRYLRGKDVFEAYYKRGLAKRLFLERSASVDAEKMVLCKLKTECGAGFTYKLEGMFKDMDASENLSKLFNQHLGHINKETSNFGVRVITPEYWPTYETYEINIPKEMRNTLTDYQEFYRIQHGNRNVKWHHGLATAVVSAEFRSNCRKELVSTLYQAVILLLFNKCDTWTVREIVECTKIVEVEVVKNIVALLGGRDRPKVLQFVDNALEKKENILESVKNGKFAVNSDFSDKRYRIRITQVNMKTPVEEKKDVDQEVNQDRQSHIDAAVVRIMKARKELSHHTLITDVLQQLKFPVKATDIKKRIEGLIEREYMSRDPDDASLYRYVA